MPKRKVQWEMPGRKSCRTALVCLAAWTAAGAPQAAKQPGQPSAKQQAARRSPQLGPNAEFLGWQGETALFREESHFRGRKSKVAYYAMPSGSRIAPILPSRTTGPTGLIPGEVLLSDYIPAPGRMAIVFHLDADDKAVAALGSAIAKLSDEGTGKPQSFPVVHATLTVALVREGREETVWRQRRDLTATTGEAGYVYDPQRLRFAVISPAGSTLLIELVNGAGA